MNFTLEESVVTTTTKLTEERAWKFSEIKWAADCLALKYQDADSLKPNQFDPVGKSHLPNLSSPLCIWKS